MNFESLLNKLIEDTLQLSLPLFSAELVLCGTIVLMLLVRLFNADKFLPAYIVSIIGVGISFAIACCDYSKLSTPGFATGEIFTGLLIFDQFTAFFRIFLLLFLTLVICLTELSGIPDREDGPDFYTLLIGSTIGMLLMISANHLLILFIGIEMTSVPSYVLVGFMKGRKKSSEGSLKYVVYGAGTAGVMLYGISLLVGLLGTANFSEMGANLHQILASQSVEGVALAISNPVVGTLLLGIMMVLVGIAFKLSLFPFHFWCPDAFEGASAEVAGYLSVASKGAAFALLVRFCLSIVGDYSSVDQFSNIYLAIGIGLGVIAVVSATYGNLTAYTQNNIKRLFAYSTIAHAGYMLMAVAALMVIMSADSGADINKAELASRCIQGLLYYLTVYMFMNLGAFAIVAFIRNQIFSEDLEDYKGIGKAFPVLGICMGICIFSLVGLPPFGGFFGKFAIFASLYEASTIHWSMFVVLCLAGLNTVFSLYYYVRILKTMFLEERPEGAPDFQSEPNLWNSGYVVIISAPALLLGIFPGRLSSTVQDIASVLFN